MGKLDANKLLQLLQRLLGLFKRNAVFTETIGNVPSW